MQTIIVSIEISCSMLAPKPLELLEDPKDQHHVRAQPQVVRERALVEGERALEAGELRRRVETARIPARRRVVQPAHTAGARSASVVRARPTRGSVSARSTPYGAMGTACARRRPG